MYRNRELLVRKFQSFCDDIQATLDFINWCVTSETGVNAMCKEMGFVIPFPSNLES